MMNLIKRVKDRLDIILSVTYWKDKYNQLIHHDWKKNWKKDLGLFAKLSLKGMALFLFFGFVFFTMIYLGFFGRMPSKSSLKGHQNNIASEVYSADSVLLGRYYLQDRTNVKYDEISPDVINALIATEDARFYRHSGVDTRSLARVLVKSLLMQEESSGGGSTISQQLAKNLYPRRNYYFFSTLINKVQEMIIARKLEKIYNKKEVLELYLNTVPMGGNLFGVERASLRFFNKHAKNLKVTEAAVLVGMLKATTTYNPRLNLEKSRQRRNVVLNQMVKYNYLDASKVASLKETPLILDYQYHTHSEGLAPYFREHLRLELVKWCQQYKSKEGETYNLYTDGLKIYTTIHSKIQAHAEKAVRKRMAALQKEFDAHWKGRSPWGNNLSVIRNGMEKSERYKKLKEEGKSDEEIEELFKLTTTMQLFSWKGSTKKEMSPWDSLKYYQKFLNTGLISIEPKTGFVRAWVGGINHHVFKYDHVLSKRQVGSTFKPIVYAAALEKGIEPCSYFENKLNTYPEYENWAPKNSDGQYGGEYSMRGALAHSVNTISAQLVIQAGIDPTIELAHKMGIESELPEVPSISLGVANISLFEMVKAYTTLVNEGYKIDPVYITTIIDRSGKVIRQEQPGFGKKAMSFQNAAMMINLLQGVIEEGSGSRLRSEFGLTMDIAGKTGTTQNQSDGWFIGITPDLVTGVWVGGENPLIRFRTLALGQGSHMALPVWGEFMLNITKDRNLKRINNSRFAALPPHLYQRLACESFKEEQKDDGFFDKVFGDIFPKDERSDEEKKIEKEQKEREREERWNAYRKEKQKRKQERREKKKKKWFWE